MLSVTRDSNFRERVNLKEPTAHERVHRAYLNEHLPPGSASAIQTVRGRTLSRLKGTSGRILPGLFLTLGYRNERDTRW